MITPGRPAYHQVADELREMINTGQLGAGHKLPSMSELRDTYSVSSTVIRDALNELRRDGLVIGQQGKGVFVVDPAQAKGPSAAALAAQLSEVLLTVRRLDARLTRLESQRPPEPSL